MNMMNEIRTMAGPSPPEFYSELQTVYDELNPLPDDLRWAMRAELPPGLGMVFASATIIFTPFF